MKKLISLTLAVLFCICLTSCGEDEATTNVDAEIKYSVYENEGSDMASFYLTSDIEKDGQWEFSHQELKTLSLAHDLDELQNDAYYRTLIFKPNSEGEDVLTFTLANGTSREYLIKVSKDDAGIFRIKVTDN